MKLIIGLGNPGKKYENTRHNVGFRVVDQLSREVKAPDFVLDKKFEAEVSETKIGEDRVILVKPQTFMNLSGKTVSKLAGFYKIESQNVWVVADELDLPLGVIRIRDNNKTSTHNGVKNIIETLGTSEFARFRLGIKTETMLSAEAFVLEYFKTNEEKVISQVIEKTADIIVDYLKQGEIKSQTIDLSE